MNRTTLLLVSAALAAATPLMAASPLLRFSFSKDPDYDIVIVKDAKGKHIADLSEIDFDHPVIYPAPDVDNAVIAGQSVDENGIYDSLTYFRVRRTPAKRWAVFLCRAKGFYRVVVKTPLDEAKVDRAARAALVRLLQQRRPIPGETCEPAQEISEGSRVY